MKTFVLDTNILIHDHNSIFMFGDDNKVIIPITVVEELDKLKSLNSEVGYNARKSTKNIDRLIKEKKIEVSLKIKKKFGLDLSINDNKIISCAIAEKAILISNDLNVRLKANSFKVKSEEFYGDKIRVEANELKGYREYVTTDNVVNKLVITKECKVQKSQKVFKEAYPNEYFMVKSENYDKQIPCHFNKSSSQLEIVNGDINFLGVKPLNKEQKILCDLILRDDIKLITVTGRAGSGKSLISIAGSLEQIINDRKYNRLMITKPLAPFGRESGFLPGTLDDKLQPHFASAYDSLEYIFSLKDADGNVIESQEKDGETFSNNDNIQWLIRSGKIKLESLEYIRGRTISNENRPTILIVDEAQNCTKEEIKTIVTRVGKNGKIILTGDINQVDHKNLNKFNNGLIHVIKKFYDHPIAGHIHLNVSERSHLAGIADEIL